MPNWLKSIIVLLAITAMLIAVMMLVAISAAAAIAVIAVGGLVWLLVIILGKGNHFSREYSDQ